MIKRIFLFALACFICGALKAQHQQIFDEYRMEAGDQAEMFVCKLEMGYSSTVYMNSPYLLSDDFVVGDVFERECSAVSNDASKFTQEVLSVER